MTELEKETIVACVGAAFTGIPAMLLFWWTWRRDQERLLVLKFLNHFEKLDGGEVLSKDQQGIPHVDILIRNRSLFSVRLSAVGFKIDKKVIRVHSYRLPLRLKRNADPSSNRPNIPDDSDPAEIRTGESLLVSITESGPDREALCKAIVEAALKRKMRAEEFVLSRRLAALVALESGKEFTSMPFGKLVWRSISEPLTSLRKRIRKLFSRSKQTVNA